MNRAKPGLLTFIMKHKSALIVDDEADTCFLLRNILQQKELTTGFVHSLAEAKAFLSTTTPDVIFLDNHLKDGHGIEFIPYLKEHFPDLRIIIITAFDTSGDKQNAYGKGAHYFIGKPFSRDIINRALSVIFNA